MSLRGLRRSSAQLMQSGLSRDFRMFSEGLAMQRCRTSLEGAKRFNRVKKRLGKGAGSNRGSTREEAPTACSRACP